MKRRDSLYSAALPLPAISRTAAKRLKPHPLRSEHRVSQLTDDLVVFEDTCNIYIVTDGSKAVLIDYALGTRARTSGHGKSTSV
jgi:hypothetical protein